MGELVRATIWRRGDDIRERRTARSVLIMLPGADVPLKLEGATIFVWDALERPATDPELVHAIGLRLERTDDDVRADVFGARTALCAHGAVVRDDD